MIFPTGRRTNARYRGPVESKKIDDFYVDARLNIKTIYATLDRLETSFKAMTTQVNSTDEVIKKNRINVLFDNLNLIDGGTK